MTKIYTKEELDEMIESEKGFDSKGKKDLAIHKVAIKGDLEGVKYLLQNGYKVTTNGYDKLRAIHYAVASGNYELVKFLLEKKSKATQTDKYKRTPLHYISKNTTLDIIELLIEKGADINAVTRIAGWSRGIYRENSPFYYALLYASEEIIDYFFKNAELITSESEYNLLTSVLSSNGTEIAEKYLNSIGKSLRNYGKDMQYIFSNNLSHHFPKKFPMDLYVKYDVRYDGIEMNIVENGNLEFIKILEKQGFDFNKPIHNRLPFITAYKQNKDKEVVDYILNNPNINISLTSGNKDDFYFDFYGTGISMHFGNYSSLLLEAVNKKNLEDIKRFLKTEEISEIMIFAALSGIFFYHSDEEEKPLEYLIENYYDKINPFRIFTKDKKLTMIDVIVQKYRGKNKDKILTDFCKNENVKRYLFDNYHDIYEKLGFKDYEEEVNKQADGENIKTEFLKYEQIILNSGSSPLTVKAISYNKFEYINADGKTYKSLPKSINQEEKDLFKAFKKKLKEKYNEIKNEAEKYMEENKSYTYKDWKTKYLSSTFKDITTGILWAEITEPNKRKLFFILEDGSVMNLDEDEIILNHKAEIKVIHPIHLTEKEIETSQNIIDDYEIEQVIPQINRIIYKSEKLNQNYFDEFNGNVIESRTFRKRFYKKTDWSNPYIYHNRDRKWHTGAVLEHGIFYSYDKMYLWNDEQNPENKGDVTVTINFSGYHIKAKLNQQESVTIKSVELNKTFKEIPDYILSEIYYELTKLLK